MSKRLFRSCLFLCNFLGISSLKLKNNKQFDVSQKTAFLNFFKSPIVILTSTSLSFYLPLRYEVFSQEIVELTGYSQFSVLIMMVFVYIEQVTSLSLCYINLYKNKSVLNFANNLLNQSIGAKYKTKFIQITKKKLGLTFLLAVVIVISQFLAAMSMTFLSILFFVILIYPFLSNFGGMALMKVYETFLIALLKDFKSKLKNEMAKSELNTENFLSLLNNYKNIYDLNEEFHKTFGTQLTILTCSITAMTTFQVDNLSLILKLF